MNFLEDTSLPGLGNICGAYLNSKREILAVSCEYRLLTEPRARASYGGHTLRHRIALYKKGQHLPTAFFDHLRYDVNDVAFHPTLPVIAIATGRYDGGWVFEGELILWNWETNESKRVVDAIPEVFRVAFNKTGNQILAYVLPWDEGMVEDLNLSDDSFFEIKCTFFESLETDIVDSKSISQQMAAQEPVSSESIGQDSRFSLNSTDVEGEISNHCSTGPLLSRSPIWDVKWLNENEVAIVHDDCLLEILSTSGEILQTFSGDGHGCEIIAGTPPLIHVSEYAGGTDWHKEHKSTLYRLEDSELIEGRTFIGSYTISRDSRGRILARRDRSGAGLDTKVFDYLFSDKKWATLNLGQYDVFNHYVKIDSAPSLYFVQDDIADRNPYEDFMARSKKWLCTLQSDGTITRLWRILKDDGTHASTALDCTYTYLEDGNKKAIIAAGKHYTPNPRQPAYGFIYRRNIGRKKDLWRHPTTASPTVIRYVSEQDVVIAFFLDGNQMVIDAKTGKILRQKKFTVNSMPTVICSCDVLGRNLVIGTMDGRVAITDIDEIAAL